MISVISEVDLPQEMIQVEDPVLAVEMMVDSEEVEVSAVVVEVVEDEAWAEDDLRAVVAIINVLLLTSFGKLFRSCNL